MPYCLVFNVVKSIKKKSFNSFSFKLGDLIFAASRGGGAIYVYQGDIANEDFQVTTIPAMSPTMISTPAGIAYDATTGLVYWTDGRTLNRAHYDGTNGDAYQLASGGKIYI